MQDFLVQPPKSPALQVSVSRWSGSLYWNRLQRLPCGAMGKWLRSCRTFIAFWWDLQNQGFSTLILCCIFVQ